MNLLEALGRDTSTEVTSIHTHVYLPADTYARITQKMHVFLVSKWCIFSGNTPCISRVIHEYQPKLHVIHEKLLHCNGTAMAQ